MPLFSFETSRPSKTVSLVNSAGRGYNGPMDFVGTLTLLREAFERLEVKAAFIGGFALQAAGITRSTTDVDFLILARDADRIKPVMAEAGFALMHESEDVLNFFGKTPALGRVDFLLAHRPYALAMLNRARTIDGLGAVRGFKTILPEDLIGLKVQSAVNDPHRENQDMSDIRSLLRRHRNAMDLGLVRDYFRVFDREQDLDRLLREEGLAPYP